MLISSIIIIYINNKLCTWFVKRHVIQFNGNIKVKIKYIGAGAVTEMIQWRCKEFFVYVCFTRVSWNFLLARFGPNSMNVVCFSLQKKEKIMFNCAIWSFAQVTIFYNDEFPKGVTYVLQIFELNKIWRT